MIKTEHKDVLDVKGLFVDDIEFAKFLSIFAKRFGLSIESLFDLFGDSIVNTIEHNIWEFSMITPNEDQEKAKKEFISNFKEFRKEHQNR